jgi:hypothetical protein
MLVSELMGRLPLPPPQAANIVAIRPQIAKTPSDLEFTIDLLRGAGWRAVP